MEADAYKLGHLDAALELGLTKEAWGKAVLPLGSALLGYALAPEGEKERGAILGGLGGLGVQSAIAGPGKAPVRVAPSVPSKPVGLDALKEYGRTAWAQGKEDVQKWLTTPVAPKVASLDQFKLAIDIGGNVPLPGMPGLGVSFKGHKERLPGMTKWVSRGALERGFENVQEGLSPEEAADREQDVGSIASPLLGSALATAGMLKFAPKTGVGGALLGSLGGAMGGSLFHRLTRGARRDEALQALQGAQLEHSRFPLSKHPTQTANEASPLAVSRGSGDA